MTKTQKIIVGTLGSVVFFIATMIETRIEQFGTCITDDGYEITPVSSLDCSGVFKPL